MTDDYRALLAAKQRDYYAANKEREREKARQRRTRDREKIATQRQVVYQERRAEILERNQMSYDKHATKRIETARAYRANNKETIRARKRKYAYGITPDEFRALWESQHGLCAICGTQLVEENRRTHVDHCHATGEVRGLLCADCNVGLGRFKDNPAALLRAADYVRRIKP